MQRIRIGTDLFLALRPPRSSGRPFFVVVNQGNKRNLTRIGTARMRALDYGDKLRDGFHILQRRIEKETDGPSFTEIKYLLTFKSGDHWWQLSPTKLDPAGVLLRPYDAGTARFQVLLLPRDVERHLTNYPNTKTEE